MHTVNLDTQCPSLVKRASQITAWSPRRDVAATWSAFEAEAQVQERGLPRRCQDQQHAHHGAGAAPAVGVANAPPTQQTAGALSTDAVLSRFQRQQR